MELEQLEGKFYEYMHQLGQADAGWNKEVLDFYVPYFARCHRVLDVGCGQGQFLELLESEGVDGVGIDADARMIETCREKGLTVVGANLFDYLPQHKEAFDGIFSSNLIEHLTAKEAARFLHLAFESLSPGGIFLTTTPNPESLIVHLYEFWRDATHVRLYSTSLLEFLCSDAGFTEVQSEENPRSVWTLSPRLQTVPDLLEELPSWRERVRWNVKIAPRPAPTFDAQDRTFVKRLIFSLRRRLASLLAENVLYEEFTEIEHNLSDLRQILEVLNANVNDLNNAWAKQVARMSGTVKQVNFRLYESHTRLLTAPREILVKGIRPSLGTEEQ
jgi:SAM-dependent methyltransferase